MDNISIWALDVCELYLIGGLLRLQGFVGLEDPFSSLLTEEVQERMAAARQTLTDRSYLEPTEDGFLLDGDLMKAVQIMATSDKVVVAAHDNASMFVHLGTEVTVEQESMPDGRIAISVNDDAEITKQHLLNLLTLPGAPAAPGIPFVIEAAILDKARTLVANGGQVSSCKAILAAHGLPADSADALANSLSNIISTGSLMTLQRLGLSIKHQAGLAWLIGNQGGWVIDTPSGDADPTMKWKPASSSSIFDQVQAILTKF